MVSRHHEKDVLCLARASLELHSLVHPSCGRGPEDEEAAFGSVRGTAIGVYVERPNKPGKAGWLLSFRRFNSWKKVCWLAIRPCEVFKLRDVRTHGASKDWPTASKETPSRRSYGSQDYQRAADARRSRHSVLAVLCR